MRSLYEHLKEIFESAAETTLIQETLTCFFFDAWFNMNETFDNNMQLVDYYKEHGDVVEKIAAIAGLNKDAYDNFLLDSENDKFTKFAIEWQNSFIYQCESFEKWINTHKSFSCDLTFVHHDTTLGVKDGQVTNGWNIAKRVDIGTKEYGFGDKDIYQKADIYAVSTNINVKPEDDIANEVSYWTQSIEGKESDKFVGISLKKLGRTLSHIHTYGLDQVSLSVDPKSVGFKLDIFDDVKLDLLKGVIKPGIVTSYLTFTIDNSGTTNDCQIFIRANNKGIKHAMKDPHVSYAAAVTTELKVVGAKAFAGKAHSLITQWLQNNINNCKDKGSVDYENILKNICNLLKSQGININIKLPNKTKELLDFLTVNRDTIDELYKAFEKEGKKIEVIQPYLDKLGIVTKGDVEDIMEMLYEATKWHNVSWKIINIFEAIANHIAHEGLSETIIEIYQYAKGISNKDSKLNLPYVLIGE